MIGKSRVKGVHCDEANCGRGVFQVTPGFGRSFGGGTKRLRVLSLLLLLLFLVSLRRGGFYLAAPIARASRRGSPGFGGGGGAS